MKKGNFEIYCIVFQQPRPQRGDEGGVSGIKDDGIMEEIKSHVYKFHI